MSRGSGGAAVDADPALDTERDPYRHAVGARDRSAIAFAGAAVVAAITIMVLNRRQWFFLDDFLFAFERDLSDPVGLFRPHFGHLTALPAAAFQAIYEVVGLHAYWPYQLAVVATHVAVAALLRSVMLRSRVEPVLATSASILFLFFGSGRENLMWAFQTTLAGSIAFGLAALLVADHDGESDRRDGVAGLLLCGAALCSNLGPFFAGVVAVAVVVRRGFRPLIVVVGPPTLLYLLWLVAAPAGTGQGESATPGEAAGWAVQLLGYAFQSLTHLLPLTVLFVGVVIVALVRLLPTRTGWRLPAADALPVACFVGLLGAVVSLGHSRGATHYSPSTPRYAYIAAALALPVVTWALSRFAAGRRPFVVGSSALLLVGLITNVPRIPPTTSYDDDRVGDREMVSAIAEIAVEERPTPGYRVYALFTNDVLIEAHRRGEVPASDASKRQRDRARIFVAIGGAQGPAGPCRDVDPAEPLELSRGDRVQVDGSHVVFSLPGAADGSEVRRQVPGSAESRGFDILVDRIDLLVRPETEGADVRLCRPPVP